MGEVNFKIKNFEELSEFELSSFLSSVKNIISAEENSKLQKISEAWVNISVIQEKEYQLKYDTENLRVSIFIPMKLRKISELTLGLGEVPRWADTPEKVPSFSAYLNYSVFKEFQNDQKNPLELDLEGTASFKKKVLKNNWSYEEDRQRNWKRESTFLLVDNEEKSIRSTFGDLNFRTVGFQQNKELGGLSIAKEFGIKPYRLTTPKSSKEFILKEDSTVKIIINNVLIRTIELKEGKHNLKNLPINQGINNVTLEVIGKSGRKEVIAFNTSSSFELLDKGLHDYSYSLGYPSSEEDDAIKYNQGDVGPFFSMYHYYGYNNKFTYGVNLQGDEEQYLAGIEGVKTTIFGNFSLQSSFSHSKTDDKGIAGLLSYDYVDYKGPKNSIRNFRMTSKYLSPKFGVIDVANPRNNINYEFNFSYSQRLFQRSGMTLGYNLGLNRNRNEKNTSLYSGSISSSIDSGLSFNVLTQRRIEESGQRTDEVLLSLNWSETQSGINVNGNYSNINKDKRLSVNYTPKYFSESVKFRTELSKSENDESKEIEAQIVNQRFDLLTNYIDSKDSLGQSNSKTRMNLSGSLVYADNSFGIGRRINDSFILFEVNENIDNKNVLINANENGSEAETGFLGNAVLSNIRSYRFNRTYLSTIDFEPGESIGKEEYITYLPLNSGLKISLGEEKTIIVKGKLYDKSDKKLSLKSGLVTRSDNNLTNTFFTNRKGSFFIEGLKPGRYTIKVYGEEETIYQFELNKKDQGFVLLGKLKPIGKEN